jgi:hypothetical protein
MVRCVIKHLNGRQVYQWLLLQSERKDVSVGVISQGKFQA